MWKTPDWKIKWKFSPQTVKFQDPDINIYTAALKHIINSGKIRPLQIKKILIISPRAVIVIMENNNNKK